jgi:DinB superfamily/Pentapeptide repeats (8 copies)
VAAEFTSDDDLRGATFHATDLSGAVFREADLSGVRMHGVLLVDVELSGLLQGLIVNDVDVGPLIEAELDRRHPERLWMRSDDPRELRRGWEFIEDQWASTAARIRSLPEEMRQQRVGGEWSATETLRHLIFVTDSWFSHEVVRAHEPFHASGLPPDFVPNWDEMGIDRTATPSFDEVADVRAGRQAILREWLAAATADDLARPTASRDDGWWPPPGERTVASCVHVVFDEEWWHHRYAVRDLAILEGGAPATP